jgi:tol-pal system protein YbgF
MSATLRRWPGARAVLAAAGLVLAAGSAQAGLFDDEEARKAILDLRARIAASDEKAAARSAELAEQIATLKRSLLDLNNQLEATRADMAKLRGGGEQMQRDITDLQKRQKDTAQVLDERMRKFEPAKVAVDGKEFMADPDERRAYDEAMASLRSGEFDKAVAGLGAFQKRYPASGYGDSVRFWLGNALYGKRDYKDAVASFRAFVTASPEHPRAPEALLALANSQAEMKDPRGARKTIDELLKSYPSSEAALAGKDRLTSLK